jgi:hypothetical protein
MEVKILSSGWSSQYFLPVLTHVIRVLFFVLKQASLYYKIRDVRLPHPTISNFCVIRPLQLKQRC